MLDIGWSEMALILMVALIVIGPKDLPRLARTIGQWTAKARSMAREFQRSLDDMAREAELQDIKAELDKVSRGGVGKRISEAVDPGGEMRKAFEPPRLDGGEARPQAERGEPTAEEKTPEPEPRAQGEPAPQARSEPAQEPAHAAEKR
jgi:sec-independent protein translocase protein TatB